MNLSKIKLVVAFAAAVGLLGVGGGAFVGRGQARDDAAPPSKTANVSTEPATGIAIGVLPGAVKLTRDIELRNTLASVCKYEGVEDPKSTLQDVLAQLEARFQFNFDINESAFAPGTAAELMKLEIAAKAPMPAMVTTLGQVVRKILARLPAKEEVTYVVRDDRIEITTAEALRRELGLAPHTPLPPLIYEHFEDTPVLEALERIAKTSGLNVVVDPGAVVHAKDRRFSAWMRNVPAETAVRLIAASIDNPVVRLGNVLHLSRDSVQAEELDRNWRNSQDPKGPKPFEASKTS
jgi:hypothetical protein